MNYVQTKYLVILLNCVKPFFEGEQCRKWMLKMLLTTFACEIGTPNVKIILYINININGGKRINKRWKTKETYCWLQLKGRKDLENGFKQVAWGVKVKWGKRKSTFGSYNNTEVSKCVRKCIEIIEKMKRWWRWINSRKKNFNSFYFEIK